jgi:hypothetical protein
MFSKSASHNAQTSPKFELITGGLGAKPSQRPEGAAFAALGQALPTEVTPISREDLLKVATELLKVMQGAENLLISLEENHASFGALVKHVAERAHQVAMNEKSLNVAMQALAQCQPAIVTIDDQMHLVVSPSKLDECASLLANTLKLPCFFSPGIGLVEVEEEPLFGGWRCSPVPVAELAKALRAKVQLHWLQGVREGESAGDVDLYDHFAKELAGTETFNGYFPELTGMVFVGHTTSDGRVIKRSGFDKRTGLYAMTRKPFRAANDEPMAVAA